MSIEDPYDVTIVGLIPVCVNIVVRTLNYLKIKRDPNEVYQEIVFSIFGNRQNIGDGSGVILDEKRLFEAVIRWSETMFLSDTIASKEEDRKKLE